jgi:flagellar basal body-associated protein FliL
VNDEPEVAPPDAAPKTSKLLLMVAVLCVANAAYSGFSIFKGGKKSGSSESSHESKEKDKEKEGKDKDGKDKEALPSVAIDPLVVNLNEADSNRYLKTTIEIEFTSAAALEDYNRNKKGVRDQLLRFLSSLTVADTLGEPGKAKIQDGIMARIEKEIGPKHVRRLFYSEFVVQ